MTRLLKNYFAFYRIFYVSISFALLLPLIDYTAELDNKVMALRYFLWVTMGYRSVIPDTKPRNDSGLRSGWH